jgi:two-component system cell cycle response regulator CpdR
MSTTATREILIVDDDDHDVALFRRILERAGHSVTDCNSGKLAMQAIHKRAFDLVILDLSIFDMDGFEVLRAVRKEMLQLRILVVSGFLQGRLLDAARVLGATAVLDKAVAVDLLLASVDKLLDDEIAPSSLAG